MVNNKKLLEPSILAFNKATLINDLKKIKSLGISQVHFDVMDGQYTKNVSVFDINDVKNILSLGIDVSVHLMGYNFIEIAQDFAALNVKAITFQYEAAKRSQQDLNNLMSALIYLQTKNIKTGIAINPTTNLLEASHFLNFSDIVTIMSVQAGKGGQTFDENVFTNLKALHQYKAANDINDLIIQIDGGININTIKKIIHDVDWIVSGSAFYQYDDEQKKAMVKLVNNASSN